MRTLRKRACWARSLFPALAVVALAPVLAPVLALAPQSASADTDLDIGGTGVVAYANGDNVRLRTAPGYENEIITFVPEGTAVDIRDGIFTAGDGTRWYEVAAGGETGYMVSDFLAASSALLAATSGTATATDVLNLRSGPSLGDEVVTVIPSGAAATLTGENQNGWLSVSYDGIVGYSYSAFLTASGATSSTEQPVEPAEPAAPAGVTYASGTRWMLDAVNLRSSAGSDERVLDVLASGTAVELTGAVTNGFAEVMVDGGGSGWVAAEYLGERAPDGPVPVDSAPDEVASDEAAPDEATPDEPAGAGAVRYTTDAVNLRTGAGLDQGVLRVLTVGTTVELTGSVTNGFAEVAVDDDGDVGWVSAEFLAESPAAAPAPPSTAIVWPVQGGEWEVSQGYNGSSHVNRNNLWQYQYSFDLIRTDGGTAGQPVYSPVDGTVRWYDPSTGGISIDMGDGRAFAMFHAEFDAGIAEGESISQGQYLGSISAAGAGGNGGFPHLHITVWETNDGGNWSRAAVPFSGRNAIAGLEFPNSGAASEHDGFVFTP